MTTLPKPPLTNAQRDALRARAAALLEERREIYRILACDKFGLQPPVHAFRRTPPPDDHKKRRREREHG